MSAENDEVDRRPRRSHPDVSAPATAYAIRRPSGASAKTDTGPSAGRKAVRMSSS